MSLRLRTLLAVALVLLIGSISGLAVAGWQASQVLHEELTAALSGGRQAVAGVLAATPKDQSPAAVRRLVKLFDGDRHLVAELVAPTGEVAARSAPFRARPAPDWFSRAFEFPMAPVTIPTAADDYSLIVLRPLFANDVGAIWREFVELSLILTVSTISACAIIWLTVGRALRPLAQFAPAFMRIGSGDYGARVDARGPLELMKLGQGVNEMTARLATVHARNQALEAQLTTLQEEERADMARDLHDEVGPHLFAVNVDTAMVRRLIEEGNHADALLQVKSIEHSVTHMQTLVRDILSRLRPTELVELGLVDAIAELVAFWRSKRPALQFDLCIVPEDRLPHELRTTIYRIVQEGLSNAVRHGRPHKIAIHVSTPEPRAVEIRIADDGAHAASPTVGGFGLIGMRERVVAANGELTIDRGAAGHGWTVTARLPMSSSVELARVD